MISIYHHINMKFLYFFNIAVIFFSLNVQASNCVPLRILFTYPWVSIIPGGLPYTVIAQAKKFIENGSIFIIHGPGNTCQQQMAAALSIPYEICSGNREHCLQNDIIRLCKKYDIQFVITPAWEDIVILKKIAQEIPIKIIFNRHASIEEGNFDKNVKIIKDVDGIVAHPLVINFIKKANTNFDLGLKNIAQIAPFWDEEKCLYFKTHETKKDYFKRKFNIKLDNSLVICTLANLVPVKNHALLFKALNQLIYEKKYKIHAMIAGEAPSIKYKEELIKMINDLGLQHYVHFLGFVDDTPALLYHSDIHVMTSHAESFPLANLEAASMKKPILMPDKTGGAYFIKDGQTGILFKNNDVHDLVQKLEFLINNQENRINLGNSVCHYLKKNYTNDMLYEHWVTFLDQVLKENKDDDNVESR